MESDPSNAAGRVHLAGVNSGPDLEAHLASYATKRFGATDRVRRTVERRQQAVAGPD